MWQTQRFECFVIQVFSTKRTPLEQWPTILSHWLFDVFVGGGVVLPSYIGIIIDSKDVVMNQSGFNGMSKGFWMSAALGVETKQIATLSLGPPWPCRPWKVSEQVLPMAAVLCGNDHSRRLIDTCRSRGLKGTGMGMMGWKLNGKNRGISICPWSKPKGWSPKHLFFGGNVGLREGKMN